MDSKVNKVIQNKGKVIAWASLIGILKLTTVKMIEKTETIN